MAPPPAPDFRPHYHELHRVGRPGWWRSLLGAVLLLVLVFGVVPLALGLLALVAMLAGGTSAEDAGRILDITEEVTPAGLAALNLLLGSAILSKWLVLWLFHRLKPRWLSSSRHGCGGGSCSPACPSRSSPWSRASAWRSWCLRVPRVSRSVR